MDFNFLQFLGKFGEMLCWYPHRPEGLHPHLGEIKDPPLKTLVILLNPCCHWRMQRGLCGNVPCSFIFIQFSARFLPTNWLAHTRHWLQLTTAWRTAMSKIKLLFYSFMAYSQEVANRPCVAGVALRVEPEKSSHAGNEVDRREDPQGC